MADCTPKKLSDLDPLSLPIEGTDEFLVVRPSGDPGNRLSFTDLLAQIPGGSAVWGGITGNIGDQTDLAFELGTKAVAGPIAGGGSGLTIDHGTVAGRFSVGTGDIEEIVLGLNFALTGSQLDVVMPWGDITGTLSDQADLQAALDAKANVSDLSGYVKLDQTSPQTIGATGARLAKLWATDLTVTNAIAGSVTGNAATATVLATPRNINGVAFNGSADITVTAAASTLTGTTLASGVVTSSLTTVGALASGSLATGFVVGGVTMTLGSDASFDLYYRNGSGILTRLGMGTTGQYLAANTGAAPTWGTPAGAGTVTNTGTLTSNSVVLGNGTADVKVVAGITTDGTSQINLGVASTTLGKLKVFGSTSGDATLQTAAVAGTATIVTLPNASSTLPIFGQQITFSGPTAARTITLPDANFTVARTDSGQTFTGTNIFTSLNVVGISNSFTSKIEIDDSSWSAGRTLTFNPGTNANAYITFPTGVMVAARQDAGQTFTGVQVMTSPALTTPAITGAATWQAGVRQTFNPNATTPGFNPGSVSGDPSTPSNGDMWYDSTGNLLRARINGATVSLGAGGGSGTVTHTGNLTAGAIVLGNGTADVTVDAAFNVVTGTGSASIVLGINTVTRGKLKLFGNTSGDATIQPASVAGTATVVTLPNASSTLPIFGQQITFSGPTAARTVTLPDASFTVARTDAANTFTGVQTMTSPDLTTPVIKGATSSGSTSIDFSGNSGTFKSPTGACTMGSSLTVNGVDITGYIPVKGLGSGNYTGLIGDANTAFYHPTSDGTARTWTIPANSSVAYPIGTTLTFENDSGAGVITIQITTDTLVWLPSGSTGSRTLAANGSATAHKVDTTRWLISGVGLT